jgi:hypothetical protein
MHIKTIATSDIRQHQPFKPQSERRRPLVSLHRGQLHSTRIGNNGTRLARPKAGSQPQFKIGTLPQPPPANTNPSDGGDNNTPGMVLGESPGATSRCSLPFDTYAFRTALVIDGILLDLLPCTKDHCKLRQMGHCNPTFRKL